MHIYVYIIWQCVYIIDCWFKSMFAYLNFTVPTAPCYLAGGWLSFNSSMEWQKMASNWMPSSTPWASPHVLGPSAGNRQLIMGRGGLWKKGCKVVLDVPNVFGANMNLKNMCILNAMFKRMMSHEIWIVFFRVNEGHILWKLYIVMFCL